MFRRKSEETEHVTCPYNSSHIIMRHRFQVHLVRCRRSHTDSQMVTCPFNITHRVRKPELNWHVTNCADRQSFEVFKTSDVPIPGLSSTISTSFCGNVTGRFNVVKATDEVVEEDKKFVDENWDLLPDAPSYDPSLYSEKSKVLRMPVGLTPKQRQLFRESERKRLQNIK